jgi:hypothetical protein
MALWNLTGPSPVRVTWPKDATMTATAGGLLLGRNEGLECDDGQ